MKKIIIILSLLFLFLTIPSAYAVTAWVDDNGEAVWADCQGAEKSGTAACPLSAANTNASAGDTVNMRTGSYSTQIIPTNSGTSGNQITYTAYNSEVVTLTNNVCINLQGKNYITINDLAASNINHFLIAENPGNSHYNIISNNTISNVADWGAISLHDNCTYWQIIDNVITNAHGSAIQLYDACHYNRIESNTIVDSHEHDSVMIRTESHYNVVRNNEIYNSGLHSGADRQDGMIMIILGSDYNLIEDNTLYETGTNYNDSKCNGLKLNNGDYNIIRRNLVYDMDEYAFQIYTNEWDGYYSDSKYNVIYNNTMYNCELNPGKTDEGAITLYRYTPGYDVHLNYMVNNNIHTDGHYGVDLAGGIASVYDNVWRYNNLYNITNSDVRRLGSNMSYSTAESSYPAEFSNNMSVDSDFTDADNADFTLKSTSGLIDAGIYLTEANGVAPGGNSDQLTVDFAGYFWAGNGVIGSTADYVYIVGDGSPANVLVQISSISGNVITIASAQNWEDNADIYLAYSSTLGIMGSGVDVGALEYDLVISNVYPIDEATGIPIEADLTWTNPTGTVTVDVYFDEDEVSCPPGSPTKVINDGDVETYVIPGDMGYLKKCCWRVDVNHAGGTETGTDYEFMTQGFPSSLLGAAYLKGGMPIVYNPNGAAVE